jgi:zona occludens toxin (predicted ATPase)
VQCDSLGRKDGRPDRGAKAPRTGRPHGRCEPAVITLLTGPPGHGKSYVAVKLVCTAIEGGKPVATNVRLLDGWSLKLARNNWIRRVKGREHCERVARRYRSLYYYSEDVTELLRVRYRGEGEGRARLILDECHRWMNSRMWDQALGLSKDEAVKARLAMVDFFSGHRHYGLDVHLITQDELNVDRQLRSLYEYLAKVKNVKRQKVLGVPIMPFNLFVMRTVWNDKAKSVVGVTMFRLDKTVANMYDTHALAATDHPENVIWLPSDEAVNA